MSIAYLRNTQSVVSETFDDDTVLINFEKGTYFSLRGSAPRIWAMLGDRPVAPEAIAALIGADTPEMSAQVRSMLDSLAAEGCILAVETDEPADPEPSLEPATAFAAPLVESFHDLKELIVIDPVHEVDTFDGWPSRPGPLSLG